MLKARKYCHFSFQIYPMSQMTLTKIFHPDVAFFLLKNGPTLQYFSNLSEHFMKFTPNHILDDYLFLLDDGSTTHTLMLL